MGKLKLGLYWAASCGGCEISILEIHDKILKLLEVVDIVFWPCIADFKYRDLEQMPDASMDICLFNGGIRTQENREIAELLRKKSKILVAYGACSVMGGIPGLANLFSTEELFDRVYRLAESTHNPNRTIPQSKTKLDNGETLTLPPVFPRLRALHHVVDVDYFVPGCPPTDQQTWAVLEAITSGALPPKGSVLGAGDKSVCDECPFEKKDVKVKAFKRVHEVIPDHATCLLEQGLICMGPATRSGCEARCLTANMPCRGCYGNAPGVLDQGAKMIGVLGSIVDFETEGEIAKCMDGIVDPVATFYRFGLPASLFGQSKP